MKRKAVIFVLLVFAVTALAACGKNPIDIQQEYVSMIEKPVSEKQIEQVEAYLDETLSDMDEDAVDEMLIEYEQYIYPHYDGKIDYDHILKHYGKFASSQYLKLCDLKKLEKEKPATKAGKLSITRKELCSRANDLELFIRQNQQKKTVVQDADVLYKNYIKLLLAGTTETPNFDLHTELFSTDADKTYRNFAQQNPDTVLADVFKEYLAYVEKIGGKLNLSDAEDSKAYYSTCSYLEAEAGKRVLE